MERPVFRLVVNNTTSPGPSPAGGSTRPPSRRRELREPLLREVPATRQQVADAMAKIRRILAMEPPE